MCGSAAWLPENMSAETVQRFTDALGSLSQRGPEATEIASADRALVGHCRLALRDVAGGRQPWKMSDGRWLAFVGEIYNCHSLRQLLHVHGAKLETSSDTEIVANAIELWGDKAYGKFNGMFAITILDPARETLELIRDRHGLKPLYFNRKDGSASASSETGAILNLSSDKCADQNSLLHLLHTSQLACNHNTVWSDISLLKPGGHALLSRMETEHRESWDEQIQQTESKDTYLASVTSKIRYLLEEAVHLQQQADYPVGVFLSGGLDSSIVAAINARQATKPTETFSVALEGDLHDLDAAREVSSFLKSRHTELVVSAKEFFKAMRELIELRGVPVVLPNEALIYLLSKKARQSVKAVLSGEGADELFGGYHKLAGRIAQTKNESLDFAADYRNATAWFALEDLKKTLRAPESLLYYEESSRTVLHTMLTRGMSKTRMLRTLLRRDHLPHLLLRLDGASMAASLEARAPFTDNVLVEYVDSIDDAFLQPRFGLDKPTLRDAASGILPERLLKRPKRAFHASLATLLDSDIGKRHLHSAIKQPLIQKLFLEENLNRLLNQESRTPIRHKNWLICSLGMWAEIHRVTKTN